MKLDGFVALVGMSALAGCFGPEISEGLPCGELGECPPGQDCIQGICLLPGVGPGDPDAGPQPVLSFRDGVDYGLGVSPHHMVVADFMNDTYPDILVTGGADNAGAVVRLFDGQANGMLSNTMSFAAGIEALWIVVDDIDGLGGLDMAYLYNTVGGQEVGVVRRNPNNSTEFLPVEIYPVESKSLAYQLLLLDANGDGRKDIVQLTYDTADHPVRLQDESQSFPTQSFVFPGSELASDIVLTDVNGDEREDLLTTSVTGAELRLQSITPGVFEPPIQLNDENSENVVVADMDADGHKDIVLATPDSGSGAIAIVPQDTNVAGSFLAPRLLDDVSLQPVLAAADLNRDGSIDLMSMTGQIAMQSASEVGVFIQSDEVGADLSASPIDVLTADFNRDNKPDIAILHGERNERNGFIRVFIQD